MYEKELAAAVEAAILAGIEIDKIYKKDFAVSYKSDNSPLTEADILSNKTIERLLTAAFPQIPILSEESAAIDYETRRNLNRLWIVDPLDGTKEFVNKNGEFTVNVALVEDGDPLLGAIYLPTKNLLYFAAKSLGAFKTEQINSFELNKIIKRSKQITVGKLSSPFIKVVASRSHCSDETKKFIDSLRSQYQKVEAISAGSSLKFCLVAEGSANFYPRFAPTMEWDTAAGDAIVRLSGGTVCDFSTGKPLKYNKKSLLNPWFLAKN